MPHQLSSDKLRKHIITYLTGYMIVSSVIIAAMVLIPYFNNLKNDAETALINSAHIRAVAVEKHLAQLLGVSNQVSNKTGIRNILEKYSAGGVNHDQLVAFIYPRFKQSMEISENIIGIRINDSTGKTIVSVGTTPPEILLHGHGVKHALDYIHAPVMLDGDYCLYTHIPIFSSKGSYLGSDFIFFEVKLLRDVVTDPSVLGMETHFSLGKFEKGAVETFISDDSNSSFNTKLIDDQLLGMTLGDGVAPDKRLIRISSKERNENFVAAFAPIKSNGWILLGKLDEKKLYNRVYSQTTSVALVILLLVLIGTGGMSFLMRPLTGRVLVYSSEMEELNRQLTNEISAHKVAEKDLKISLQETASGKNRVSAILNSVPDALIVVDRLQQVVLLNPTAEKLFELDSEEASGKPLLDLIADPDMHTIIEEVLRKAESDTPRDISFPEKNPASTRTFQTRISLFSNWPDDEGGTIVLLQDVTQQRRMEHMKSEFISTAAHELRTPMATIMGFSELLLGPDEISSEQRQQFLTYIFEKTEDLSRILDDMLDINRIESGRSIYLFFEPVTVDTFFRQSVMPYQQCMVKYRVEIDLEEGETVLQLDRVKVGQVMENILSNAIKYSPEGSCIRVHGQPEGDFYQISVADQGIGMTVEQQEMVFDKFYRADSSNTAAKGIGLGMFIVRHIILDHGGQIWIESERGKGTVVSFTLPTKERLGHSGLSEKLNS